MKKLISIVLLCFFSIYVFSQINFKADETTQMFRMLVEDDIYWTAKINNNYFTITPSEGKGEIIITINCDENETNRVKEAVVVFTDINSNVLDFNISILQEAKVIENIDTLTDVAEIDEIKYYKIWEKNTSPNIIDWYKIYSGFEYANIPKTKVEDKTAFTKTNSTQDINLNKLAEIKKLEDATEFITELYTKKTNPKILLIQVLVLFFPLFSFFNLFIFIQLIRLRFIKGDIFNFKDGYSEMENSESVYKRQIPTYIENDK